MWTGDLNVGRRPEFGFSQNTYFILSKQHRLSHKASIYFTDSLKHLNLMAFILFEFLFEFIQLFEIIERRE